MSGSKILFPGFDMQNIWQFMFARSKDNPGK